IELSDYYLLIVGYRVGMVLPDEGISATRAEFRHARALRRKTGRPKMLHLVRREVAEARGRGHPEHVEEDEWPPIESFLEEVRTMPPSKLEEYIRVDPDVAYGIVRFRLTLRRGVIQNSSALEEAINSGAFLDYRADTDSYVVSPLQALLLELRQQARSLDGIVTTISTYQTIA